MGDDGGIIVSKGQNEVRLNLSGVYKDFLDRGFTLKGYGFSVKTIYIN